MKSIGKHIDSSHNHSTFVVEVNGVHYQRLYVNQKTQGRHRHQIPIIEECHKKLKEGQLQ